jgi:lipoprotein-anchoring transpeptidase ErfK/SrfK
MQAWLTIDGRVIRGPVPVRAGGPGKETPIGRFTVLWKEQLHFSSECNNTPMPYSVFFTSGGVAFHSGNMERPSAGCLKLSLDDAEAWYSTLEVGDEVWIHGSESRAERACRIGLAPEECGPVGNSELAR